ncbi:MAG TPA: DUF2332 domain-containing protein [Iamia sp.]|nr:DUF2332 domain-containing protein [Iamia sp.]
MAPDLAGRFREFAATYAHLPLYSRISGAAAEDPAVWGLLTAARPGQERPVLLLAALHDLVLRSPSVPAARWFAAAPDLDGDPWPDVRVTLLAHAPELRAIVAARSTQTNEVNRVVYLAALLVAATADVGPVPVALVEQGASAGLLLGLDRYRIEVGDVVLGDPASPVRCSGALEPGSAVLPASSSLPPIASRVGIDLAPVALSDAEEVRWLEACLWPDQPERLARFRAAVALLRPDPPPLVAGDMVDDLAAVAGATAPDTHLVVTSSWALTYVRRDRRPLVPAALAALATSGRPVSWLTAEPPARPAERAPGGETVLTLHRWRAARPLPPVVVGHAHPHAPWLHLTPLQPWT